MKRHWRGILLCLLTVIFGGAGSAANTWYVATTGTDGTGCGTATNPCKTIQYPISNLAVSGDTVSIAAGTYSENLSINQTLYLTGSKAIVDGGGAKMPTAVIGTGGTVEMAGLTLQNGTNYI